MIWDRYGASRAGQNLPWDSAIQYLDFERQNLQITKVSKRQAEQERREHVGEQRTETACSVPGGTLSGSWRYFPFEQASLEIQCKKH